MATPIKPEPGLVIRFDFLFQDDLRRGQESGKGRPVVVVIVVPESGGTGQTVIVAPITHTSPSSSDEGIPLPAAVARHLGLDERPMWLKPRELNRFLWLNDRLPFGLEPIEPGQWSYGQLPPKLHSQLKQAVLNEIKAGRVKISKRG